MYNTTSPCTNDRKHKDMKTVSVANQRHKFPSQGTSHQLVSDTWRHFHTNSFQAFQNKNPLQLPQTEEWPVTFSVSGHVRQDADLHSCRQHSFIPRIWLLPQREVCNSYITKKWLCTTGWCETINCAGFQRKYRRSSWPRKWWVKSRVTFGYRSSECRSNILFLNT